MKQERGYILITVLIVVFVMTLATILLSGHTLDASFFSARRTETVRAYALAESAAMEGFWQLSKNAGFRGTGERHWGTEWYEYSIIDPTPASMNDLTLDVLGCGYIQGADIQRSTAIRLHLSRINTATSFEIDSETEESN